MIPQKILFISEGQLGDLLLLTPALRATKRAFSSARVSVLIVERRKAPIPRSSHAPISKGSPSQINSVLATNPNVDELLIVDRDALRSRSGLGRLKAELDVVRALRKENFDVAICMFPEDRFVLWAFASGAKIRVGQRDQPLHWLLTHKPDLRKDARGVLEYYCELVRAIGVTVESRETEFQISERGKRWAQDFLLRQSIETSNQLVAIHPGATGNYKIWPPESYARLIDRLQSEADVTVVLCSGSQDGEVVDAIKRCLQTHVLEAITTDDVEKLGALLQRCSLCVSNDSGPRHLAAALGVPSLAFLRQYHDREWKVYPEDDNHATLQGTERCPACPSGVCLDRIPERERFGSYCMRMIGVEEAFTRIRQLLNKRPLSVRTQ